MEDRTISMIFPHPPALNHLYFNQVIGSGQRAYVKRGMTQAGRDYMELIAEISEGFTPFLGDVEVEFKWYRPRKVGDLDGIFKVILDGMTGHVYIDDKQVKRIVAERFEDPDHPHVKVDVRPLGLF